MTPQIFIVAFMLGAAAIALWVVHHAARRAPSSIWSVAAHVFAAYVLSSAVLPLCIAAVPALGPALAVMGIAFPPLVYFFVACAWLLLFLQRLLSPVR